MKQSNNIAIKLTNISKKYILHHEKPTLVENVFRFGRKEEIWALKDINLEIKKGEKLGIIGDNGSGKSTLLKIITGITAPTTGKIKIKGRIAALIGLDAGFHPELTGQENIYLNAMLLGMKRNEIKKRFDQITKFADLKDVIDTPLFTYSSGMRLRLGFSIAIHANPNILLIDEVLGVGDQDFQQKSFAEICKMIKKNKTIVYVSHYLEDVVQICDRVVWIKAGKIYKIGETKGITEEYEKQRKEYV